MATKTHWKKLTNPDYLGAYSLEDGQDMVLTIASVRQEMITGDRGRKEECTVARFSENVKPMILNKTNCKTIEKLYKTPFIEDWSGRRIRLYVDPNVQFAGETVSALRIRNEVPQQNMSATKLLCDECGSVIEGAGSKSAKFVADYTHKKYGKSLCSDCAAKAAAALDPLGAAKPDETDPEEPEESIDAEEDTNEIVTN